MGTYRREGDNFDQGRKWQDLSRSEKNFALSFSVVVGGVVALAVFGLIALIHRLLF